MKYIILCLVMLAVCIALGTVLAMLIGRAVKKRGKRIARPFCVLLAAVFAAAIACGVMFGYLGIYYHADGTAEAALESGEGVTVTHNGRVWSFDGPGAREALIFYPGAKVEAAAYAPLLRDMAARGVDCFLAEMPFRMAVFGSDAAADIMAAHDYETWFVGGHSLGGTIAAGFAADHADELAGVILFASYPNGKLDDGLELFSVYGTEDGCLDREAYEAGRAYWPQYGHTAESVLPGANHAQFGCYGAQHGDGEAEMSPDEQRRMAADQTVRFITADEAGQGMTAEAFDAALAGEAADVTTEVSGTRITQTGTAEGTEFTFVIDLARWKGHTDAAQIMTISRLFWQCYPQMYVRFGAAGHSPTEVTLAIEDEGYEIAETAGSFVHLHDRWLEEWPTDYDCLTHEFAHVIQNDWEADRLEYDGYIERFADCCRYEYAIDDGYCNDACWTLQTVRDEPDRASSVRFPVWLDTMYSTPQNDLLLNWFRVCREGRYPADRWEEAWEEIFAGSALAGTSIDDVWAMYLSSDFAVLSAEAPEGETSELLARYDVPERD